MVVFEELILPLKTLEEVFSLLYISVKCNPNLEIAFMATTFNDIYGSSLTQCDIENCLNKLTCFNYKTFKTKICSIDEKLKSKPTVCEPPYANCKFCQSGLEVKKQSTSVIFRLNAIQTGLILSKACNNCNITYYIDKFEKDGSFYTYENLNYISISSETLFEVNIIFNI